MTDAKLAEKNRRELENAHAAFLEHVLINKGDSQIRRPDYKTGFVFGYLAAVREKGGE